MRRIFLKSLALCLLILPLPISIKVNASQGAPAEGWNYPVDAGARNPYFWEFKYFNFHDSRSDLKGNISFFTASPRWIRTLIVTVHLYGHGTLYSYQKTFPLSCVRADIHTGDLELCPKTSPLNHSAGGLRMENNGDVSLQFSGEKLDISLRYHPLALDGEKFYFPMNGRLMGQKPWMNWQPLFVDADVEGTVSVREGQKPLAMSVHGRGYHDRNWGLWKPVEHPYRWLHFTNHKTGSAAVSVLLTDLYRAGKKILIVATHGTRKIYLDDSIEVTELAHAAFPVTRYGPFDSDTLHVEPLNGGGKMTGIRPVPSEVAVRTKDGAVDLDVQTLINDSTGTNFPTTLLTGDFRVNEQIVGVKGIIKAGQGPAQSVDGAGEAQFVGQ